MCKTEFAVEVDGEQGRLKNLRKEDGMIVGTFIPRRSSWEHKVPVAKVTCMHSKSAKNLQKAIKELSKNGNGQQKEKKK